jgi:hypothetical protein
MPNNLTPQIIAAAIEGFEGQKNRLDAQIAELKEMLKGRRTESAAAEPLKRKRRRIRAASAEAQQKSWATTKQRPSLKLVTLEAPKRKRKLSAAGRKRIIEALKRRWALKRAESENAQKSSAKKRGAGKIAAKRAAA